MKTAEEKKVNQRLQLALSCWLDITKEQHEEIVKMYEEVGEWLASKDSPLSPYSPKILAQGSFMLGTMIQPVRGMNTLDIDLVCQLEGKNPDWTQKDIKEKVGKRIAAHPTYKKMMKEEGRRCWTLQAASKKNKMDILPSIVDKGYYVIVEKAFSDYNQTDTHQLALRITDKTTKNYATETNHMEWMKSNPFGYGHWFFKQARLGTKKGFNYNESIDPVPKYTREKLPLQIVVQFLKRHRDEMFLDEEDKPISIIITTLAAKAYKKEASIMKALENVLNGMRKQIKIRWSEEHKQKITWIGNPVNPEENFADKWVEYPQRKENFFKWLDEVENFLNPKKANNGK